MSWVAAALEKAKEAVDLDVEHLGLMDGGEKLLNLQMMPLSMAEYQVLKSDPEIRKLTGRDRDELLGVRMAFEMLKKCDSSLNWKEFQTLPIATLTGIAVATAEALGGTDGGRLGE